MAWTLVQSTDVQNGSAPQHTLAFPSSVGANHTLFIAVHSSSPQAPTSVLWSVGGSMTPVKSDNNNGGNPYVHHYVARGSSSGNHTIQVNFGSSIDCSIAIEEWNSGNTGDTVRSTGDTRTGLTTTPSVSTADSAPQVGDLVLITDGHDGSTSAVTQGTGYTLRHNITSSVNVVLAGESKEVTGAGTQSGGFTWQNANHGLVITVLKPDNVPPPTPTRLYFDSAAAPTGGITPGFAAWTSTASAVRRKLNTTKGSSATAEGTLQNITSGAGNSTLDRQHITDGLAGGIAFDPTWTVKCQLLAREGATSDNVNAINLCIKVVSNDGATLRATLLALGNYGTTTELNTSLRNKTVAVVTSLTGTYTTVAGDRLVVEDGPRMTTTGTTPQAAIQYGETGTDLPVDETTTTGVGWIEFSDAITLQPSGTQFQKTLTVTVTATPTVTKKGKSIRSVTSTATPTRQVKVARSRTVTSTATPTLTKKAKKTPTVTVTATPTMTRRRIIPKVLSAIATATATLSRKAKSVRQVNVSTTSTIARKTAANRSRTVTATPTITRKARVAHSVTSTATPTLTKKAKVTHAATSTATPTLSKKVKSVRQATATATATLTKKAKSVRQVVATATASMARQFIAGGGTVFHITLSAVSTVTASMSRKAKSVRSTTSTATPVIVRRTRATRAVVAVVTPTVTKKARVTHSMVTAVTAVLNKKAKKTPSATSTATPTLSRKAGKRLAATVTATPSVRRLVRSTRSLTVSGVPTLNKKIRTTRQAVATATASLVTRMVHEGITFFKTLSVNVTATPTLTKKVKKVVAATATATPSILSRIVHSIKATLTIGVKHITSATAGAKSPTSLDAGAKGHADLDIDVD